MKIDDLRGKIIEHLFDLPSCIECDYKCEYYFLLKCSRISPAAYPVCEGGTLIPLKFHLINNFKTLVKYCLIFYSQSTILLITRVI